MLTKLRTLLALAPLCLLACTGTEPALPRPAGAVAPGSAAPSQEPAAPAIPPALAQAAAGYAAKVAASAVFVSGRTIDSVLAEELAPDAKLQALVRPVLKLDLDRAHGSVTARIGDAAATAVHIEGLGCTLAIGVDAATLRARAQPRPIRGLDARPWPLGDGPAEPVPAGVDAKALAAAIEAAFVEPTGRPPVHTRAVLVAKDGHLLAERYAIGYHRAMALPGWSATKTWTDALLGCRVREGKLDPAAPLPVPEWQAGDARGALRLDDLLRMQSGLAWNESYEAPDSDVLRMLFASRDGAALAAQHPLADAPRSRFLYSSGTTVLLCRVLRSTFGNDADYWAYPRRALWDRLGMHSALLEADPSGTLVGSSFGYATPRDWAKFGQFYLQDGVWNGERLLPEGWVAAARTPTPTHPRGGFGRHLWLNAGTPGNPEQRAYPKLPTDVFFLSGHEGQYVVVFPQQRLVVVRLGCTKSGGFDIHGLLQRVLAACGG